MFWFLLVWSFAWYGCCWCCCIFVVVIIVIFSFTYSRRRIGERRENRSRVSWQMPWTGKIGEILCRVLVYGWNARLLTKREQWREAEVRTVIAEKKPKINWRDFVYGHFEYLNAYIILCRCAFYLSRFWHPWHIEIYTHTHILRIIHQFGSVRDRADESSEANIRWKNERK